MQRSPNHMIAHISTPSRTVALWKAPAKSFDVGFARQWREPLKFKRCCDKVCRSRAIWIPSRKRKPSGELSESPFCVQTTSTPYISTTSDLIIQTWWLWCSIRCILSAAVPRFPSDLILVVVMQAVLGKIFDLCDTATLDWISSIEFLSKGQTSRKLLMVGMFTKIPKSLLRSSCIDSLVHSGSGTCMAERRRSGFRACLDFCISWFSTSIWSKLTIYRRNSHFRKASQSSSWKVWVC